MSTFSEQYTEMLNSNLCLSKQLWKDKTVLEILGATNISHCIEALIYIFQKSKTI
jgi:hypothetical protein